MKTKGFIYSISIILVLLLASCEEEHIMTKMDDSVGFVKDSYFQSVKSDFTYLEIPILHNSINVKGSKTEIEIIPGEGTTADMFSVDNTIFDFDVDDTLYIKVSIDYTKLTEFVDYSLTIKFTDKYLGFLYGGYEEVVVNFAKYSRIYEWVGNYTAAAVSNYVPGAWDEEWDISTAATDPTHLLITGIAGSDMAVEAILNTDPAVMTITIPWGQDIGDVYGYGGSTILYNSNSSLDQLETDLTGTLYEDGSFDIDYMMLYLPGEGWDWDIFTPTFTQD